MTPIKQIVAGVLDVGYAESGPSTGRPVILIHGWPYDIHSFDDATPLLTQAGYRVIAPYVRGYGSTHFLSADTVRNGQQAALGADVIALMDALKIDQAVLAGFDWGGRSADIVPALWPERCHALVSVSGYLIGSQQAGAAGRGMTNTGATSRSSSGGWRHHSGTSTMPHSIGAPHHSTIPITWGRLGLADAEAKYDEMERRPAQAPPIAVPTISLEGDANGAPHSEPSAYAAKFTGRYEHRTVTGGGHNLPQEAPAAFAKAVIDAGSGTSW